MSGLNCDGALVGEAVRFIAKIDKPAFTDSFAQPRQLREARHCAASRIDAATIKKASRSAAARYVLGMALLGLLTVQGWAADVPLFQYRPVLIRYVSFPGNVATYFNDWDAACAAVAPPPSDCVYPNICYSNARGMYQPNLGPGCQYTYFRTDIGTGVVFHQNWAAPQGFCRTGEVYDSASRLCVKPQTHQDTDACPDGNPVYASDGSKRQSETDFTFENSGETVKFAREFFNDTLSDFRSSVGWGWALQQWGRKLNTSKAGSGSRIILATRDAGRTYALQPDANNTWKATPYDGLQIKSNAAGWLLSDAKKGVLEQYSAAGVLQQLWLRKGLAFTLSYSDANTPTSVAPGTGYLISVAANQGRTLALTYDAVGRLSVAGVGASADATYGFDTSQPSLLTSVVHADGSTRRYAYDAGIAPSLSDAVASLTVAASVSEAEYNALHASQSISYLQTGRRNVLPLSGVVDENGATYATYQYDSEGRVTSEFHGNGVSSYSFNYANPLVQSVVTDPSGNTSTRSYTTIGSQVRVTSQSQAAGAGCNASTKAVTYEAQANRSVVDDFNGTRTCFVHDQERNLEVVRVEGLPSSVNCAALTAPGAALPAGSRKVSTQWHPDWAVPSRVVEPGRVTTYVYNGQPDPINGNAVANCAPSTALLLDGKPIAVLCRKVEQATTDSSGSVGFGIYNSAADASFANVSLLLHMDGANGSTGFVDNSGAQNSVTAVGDVSILSTQGKFGGGGIFDGTGDYLSIPGSSAIELGSSDFTAEAWVRFNFSSGTYTVFEKRAGGVHAYAVSCCAGGSRIYATGYPDSSNQWLGFVLTGTTAVTPGTWSHVALTRQGSTLRLFLNGALEATTSYNDPMRSGASDPLLIGSSAGSGAFSGMFDEVRLTKGVARYTSGFSVSGVPFGDSVSGTSASGVPLQSGVTARAQTWTYNAYGQPLTHDGPRADVSDLTTFSYYADTSANHSPGDLQSVTNAAGHVTQHTLYDKSGRLLQSIDANGAVTNNQYSPRGWLTQVSVTPAGGGAALLTTYGYDLAGQLTSVTYPGQGPIAYSYDAAHRLTGITDAAGNSVTYTLDNAGKRTAEQFKDPNGALAKSIGRAFDALGRVQATNGAAN